MAGKNRLREGGRLSEPALYDQQIDTELKRVPKEERRTPKLSPTQAGLTRDHRDPKHQCKTCWQFITDGRCATVGPKGVKNAIKPFGTCSHWKFGKPMSPENAVENDVKLGKIEAQYQEREDGFQCGGCNRYGAEKKRCAVVWSEIDPQDCCDLWSDGKPWVKKS